jgi:hypothetical protein
MYLIQSNWEHNVCFLLKAESLCTGTVLRTKLAMDNCIADYHINERYIRTDDRETGSVGSTVTSISDLHSFNPDPDPA